MECILDNGTRLTTILAASTPNGQKISITLEELGLQYNVHKLEFSKNQQKEPWFLEINRMSHCVNFSKPFHETPTNCILLWTANGRIPAIVDKTSGKPKRVFEGASMQLYLCEKYDEDHKISFPYDSDEYWETVEWLVWMVSCALLIQHRNNYTCR